jgi:hypothetical protein
MNHSEYSRRTDGRLVVLASLLILASVLLPKEVYAQTTLVNCATVQDTDITDTDGDGLTDYQECNGIRTLGTSPISPPDFPRCFAIEGPLPPRHTCVDPNSRDLFVIVAPAPAPDSVLPADFNAFLPVNYYGINFIGLNTFGLAVHQIGLAQADADRFFVLAEVGVAQPLLRAKAVRVVESADTNGTILGNCQWGSPQGLDGCIIFTRRTQNFIASTCGTKTIQTPSGATINPATGAAWTVLDVTLAYSTYLVLHETGHSLGGLTAEYNSRFGGYHYKPGAGLVMEQAVTYTAKGSTCTFYISPNWNPTAESPFLRLQ